MQHHLTGPWPNQPHLRQLCELLVPATIPTFVLIAGLQDASGLWNPNNGTIEIKTGEYPYEYFTSVLKHEAIHMAQSCSNFAYSLSTPSVPLGLDVTAEGMQDLATYKHSHPAYYRNPVEREAYSNDSKS